MSSINFRFGINRLFSQFRPLKQSNRPSRPAETSPGVKRTGSYSGYFDTADSKMNVEKAKSRLLITKNSDLNNAARQANRFKLAHVDHMIPPVLNQELFELRPSLMEALRAMNISELNQLQKQMLTNENHKYLLCAAETGSGKTLAYLLPTIEALKKQEDEVGTTVRQPNSPRALVLVPSAELAHQVGAVAKGISHHVKLRVGHLTRNIGEDRLFSNGPLDLLVTTPYQVLKGLDSGKFNLDELKYLIVDEADSMMVDETFGPQIEKLLRSPTTQACTLSDQLTRLTFVTATVSEGLNLTLAKNYPSLHTIASEDLHKPLKGNRYDFIKIEGPGDAKQTKLVELLAKATESGAPTLVFCNGSASANLLHAYLEKHYAREGMATSVPGLVHGFIPEQQRIALLKYHRANSMTAPHIICTDILARGVDTVGWIKHVILYDFPGSLQQFLHRAGRTGRAGTKGRVSVLVNDKDRRLAEYIRQSVQKRSRLDQLLTVS